MLELTMKFPSSCCCCLSPEVNTFVKVNDAVRSNGSIIYYKTEVPICEKCRDKKRRKIIELIILGIVLFTPVFGISVFISSSDKKPSELLLFILVFIIAFLVSSSLFFWKLWKILKSDFWFPARYNWRKIKSGENIDHIIGLVFKNQKYQEIFDRLNGIVAEK